MATVWPSSKARFTWPSRLRRRSHTFIVVKVRAGPCLSAYCPAITRRLPALSARATVGIMSAVMFW